MNFLQYLSNGDLKTYTKAVIRNYAISPKKKWGQNFVVNKKVINDLISAAKLDQSDIVIEVGGGIGTLTFYLLKNCFKVFSYEIDPILSTVLIKEFLNYSDKLEVISGDFLSLSIPTHSKIVANIPYGISSPFINKVINVKIPPKIIVITLQSEFASHLCAKSGNPDYSRISVYSSFFYDFKIINDFPSHYFYPKPKINSSLVYGTKLDPPLAVKDKKFQIFLSILFCRKHKKARNNLQIYVKRHQREIRTNFIKEIDKIEFSDEKPVNLSPNQILKLFLQVDEILRTFNI